MDFLQDRKTVLAIGGALAVLLGVGIAVGIMLRDHGSSAPPPASHAGLVVEPSGVAGVAAVLANPGAFEHATVATVLTGSNVTREQLQAWRLFDAP